MRKIDLRPYKIKVNVRGGVLDRILSTPGVMEAIKKSWPSNAVNNLQFGKETEDEFKVKESIVSILFSRDQRMNDEEYWNRGMLKKKIEECKKDVIKLEEKEYQTIKSAFSSFQGFANLGTNGIEFVRRIREAKEYDPNKDEKKKG